MIEIRRIQAGEIVLYKQMRLKALKDAPEAFGSTYENAMKRSEESWIKQVESTSSGFKRITVFAFDKGHSIGMAACYNHPDEVEHCELLQVWVDRDYRGKGVIKGLTDALFDWANEAGFKVVRATVKANNHRAFKAYQNYGFEVSETIEDEILLLKSVL